MWQNAVLGHTSWNTRSLSLSLLHNQEVWVSVTRTWLLELGPDCLKRRLLKQMPECPKGYSWNAPKILQFWFCLLVLGFFVMSSLLSESFYPFQSITHRTLQSQDVSWNWSPQNHIPLRFSCHCICEYTATINQQSVTIDACYASGYWNNLSLMGRS